MDKISHMLFDLDNTLIKIPQLGDYIKTLTLEYLWEEYNIEVKNEREIYQLFNSGKKYIKILQKWGITDPMQFWHMFDEYDFKHRKKMLKTKDLVLYDDVVEVLDILKEKNIGMSVISNTANAIANWEIDAFGLKSYFRKVVGLGDVQEECKPEADGINRILSEIGVSKKEIIYVGDSPIDVSAAFNVGIFPIWIDRKDKFHEDTKNHAQRSKVMDILEKRGKNGDDILMLYSLREIIPFIEEIRKKF